jgi:hypothetical protein
MSDFTEALEKAIGGDDGLLAGFRLERRTLAGPYLGPNALMVEEHLTVTGSGDTDLLSRRSMADISGEEIGEFHVTRSREVVRALLRAVRQSGLEQTPVFSIGPGDVRMEVNVTVGDFQQRATIGFSHPGALQPLQPLLQEMDRAASEARKRAVASLSLHLQAPGQTAQEAETLQLTLVFQNTGSEGCWITHPSRQGDPTAAEHCLLKFGLKPEVLPGITPLPVEVQTVGAQYTDLDAQNLLWVPPFGQVSFRFSASPHFTQTGGYLMRVSYASYQGGDRIEQNGKAHIRLRGCVFSNEVEVQVV